MRILDALYQELLTYPPKKSLFTKSKPAPKGIYIYGGVGRGKSMLMDIFFETLPDHIPKRRVHFHEFMIEVHDYCHEQKTDRDQSINKLTKKIANEARVLCFDEFHVIDVTDAMILGRLFRGLYKAGVVVISTSNWPPDRLYEGGLQRDRFLRFIHLLKEKQTIIHLDSPTDYRTQFLMQEGSYFTPLGTESRNKIDAIFKTLTDGIAPKTATIKVKGREIIIERTAKGIARLTFAQLCEQPHGAEDYIAIANKFHTIMLEGIPKLTYDRRNEAKRLMTLIDALYEANTKLIISADTTPEKLYRGHDHAFEFDRTISRLQEMQSAEYLS